MQSLSTSEQVGNKMPAHGAQYLAGLTGMIGAVAGGSVMGFSSPAGAELLLPDNYTQMANDNKIYLTEGQNGLFGASANLGAGIGGIIGGILINALGRKGTMMFTVVPYLLGWALIGFSVNFGMLVSGRIFTGLALGLTSLAVPTWIGEFSSADIRGTLGTSYQLGVNLGITFSYAVGSRLPWYWLSLACAALPIIYLGMIFVFVKESPVYLMSKGKTKEAESALQYYRGINYDFDNELETTRQTVKEAKQNKIGFSDMGAPHILKPLGIALTIMILQQISGINAVIFNLNIIFEKAGSSMSPDLSSIIIGIMQIASTFCASLIMDKAGRKLLLCLSTASMAVSLVALGVFFYILDQDRKHNTDNASNLGWLPILSLSIFVIVYNMGFGPIPWILLGELFPTEVKEFAGSIATTANWATNFIICMTFTEMQKSLGDHGSYWLFAGFCTVACVFCVFLVPETKGKTLEEISAMFGAPTTKNDSKKAHHNKKILGEFTG